MNEKKEETEKKKNLRELYRVLNETLNSREKNTLFVDSIMLPLSIGIVTYTIEHRTSFGMSIIGKPVAGFIPILTLLLVLIPYALHYTAMKVDDIYFDHIHKIEKELGIEDFGHQSIYNQFEKTRRGKLRHRIWHWFFIALIIAYIFISIWLFLKTEIV